LPVESGVELVNCWGDLKTGLEDSLLALKPDVLGPLDETAQIPLGLDILTDTEVAGSLLEEGVHNPLGIGLLDGQRGGCHLLALLVLSL